MAVETEGRRGAAMGDAACAWHAFDRALVRLCEARDDLEKAGRDELVEPLEEIIDAVEVDLAEAESAVSELLAGEG